MRMSWRVFEMARCGSNGSNISYGALAWVCVGLWSLSDYAVIEIR
jgi:hypothetical protein